MKLKDVYFAAVIALVFSAFAWSLAYSTRYQWRRYKERNAEQSLNPGDLRSYSIPLGRVPVSGNIERVTIRVDCKAGSYEPVDFFLRHNDRTDFAHAKIPITNDAMEIDFSGLDYTVAKDDEISLSISTPAWTTNPTQVRVKLDKLPVRTSSSTVVRSNRIQGGVFIYEPRGDPGKVFRP